jgi:hypothetical protein
MPTTTTETDVLDAFLALLQADDDLGQAGVQTKYMWPGPTTQAELVAFGEEITSDSDINVIGRPNGRVIRDEDYTFEVIVWVYRSTGGKAGDDASIDARATRVRATELSQVVERIAAENPDMGVAGVKVVKYVGRSSVVRAFDAGHACEVRNRFTAAARLT